MSALMAGCLEAIFQGRESAVGLQRLEGESGSGLDF